MAFADYDFAKHQGVTIATGKALKKRFASWEEIAEAAPEDLLEVKGVGADIVLDLQDSARAQIRQAARRAAAGDERIEDRGEIAPVLDLKQIAFSLAKTKEERAVARKVHDDEEIGPAEQRIVDVLTKRAKQRLAERYILSSKPADHAGPDGAGRVTNIKRRRKLLTDAVCDECGMDFIDKRGLGPWETLSSETRDDLRSRVQAHKQMLHGLESKLVVSGVQLDEIGRAEGAG